MRLRFVIGSFLFSLAAATNFFAQIELANPVSIQQIRWALNHTPETPEQIRKTNAELIEAIRSRGVNFVLSPEEEWALSLRDASVELIETIRNATPVEERERLLLIRGQQGLYDTFVNNYTRPDATSRQIAVDAGKEFVRRYGRDANVAEIVAYLQRAVPMLERALRYTERRSRGRPRTN